MDVGTEILLRKWFDDHPVITELPGAHERHRWNRARQHPVSGEQGTILSANYIAPTVSVDDLRMASKRTT